MIFEVLFTDEETICVAIDHNTFNEIHKMLVMGAYYKGLEKSEKDKEDDE